MQIFSNEAFQFKKQLQDMTKVQNIAVCGLFIALYIVLTYMNIRITDNLEIRFPFLILALAGYYGGPVMGLTVGAASDILSMLLTGGKGAAFNFGFTIDYALIGFLFGLVLYKAQITVPRILCAELFHVLIAATLHTYWLHLMYGMPLQVLFVTRLVKCAITFPIEAAMLYIIVRAFSKIAFHAGIQQRA